MNWALPAKTSTDIIGRLPTKGSPAFCASTQGYTNGEVAEADRPSGGCPLLQRSTDC
ncbi:MAG: hypothetical protein R2864_01985 [Syntrophotaleaceae bacterium]